MQTAYELRTWDNADNIQKGKAIRTTGKVASGQSIHIPYTGTSLSSGKRYYWQVRVWDSYGNVSGWSTPAFWQTGLMQTADWKAVWIIPGVDDSLRSSPVFRKEFSITKIIKSATAYITAHGLYEAQINRKRVGDAYLTQGYTSYSKRLQYQVYDVTA